MNLDFASYLNEMNKGQVTELPVLAEGTYVGNFIGFGRKKDNVINTLQYGIIKAEEGKTKKGVGNAWCMLSGRLSIDSAYAKTTMGSDNVIITADNDSKQLSYFRLSDFGIDILNVNFWNLVNSFFNELGVAHIEADEAGIKKYVRDSHINEAIFTGMNELYSEITADSDIDPVLYPAKLAELQLKNINELIAGQEEATRVYIDIGRKTNSYTGNIGHYVKSFGAISNLPEGVVVFE